MEGIRRVFCLRCLVHPQPPSDKGADVGIGWRPDDVLGANLETTAGRSSTAERTESDRTHNRVLWSWAWGGHWSWSSSRRHIQRCTSATHSANHRGWEHRDGSTVVVPQH